MRFEIFLAIRYLRTPRRHVLAQFTALAAIIGIAFGVAAMIFAQAVANGFQAALQDKILENTAHITILTVDGENIPDWQDWSEKIKIADGVKSVAATSFDNVLLFGKTNSSYAVLRGIQSPKPEVQSSKVKEINKSKIQNPKAEIEIGEDLAEKVGLAIGDQAEIVTGGSSLSETFVPTSTVVQVRSIFSTGLYEFDSTWIRLSLEDAARLTGKTQVAVSALEIKTEDIYNSAQIAKIIREKLGSKFKVLDWQQINRPLFAALNLERRFAVIIISLIVLIAAFNITTTLILLVNERKMDIAVLKTCGAQAKNIVFVFLLEGVLLGALGIFFGVLLGSAICAFSNYFGWINLPPDIYSINEIILEPNLGEIMLTIVATFLLCLTASSFPAWAAAKVRPLENLKN